MQVPPVEPTSVDPSEMMDRSAGPAHMRPDRTPRRGGVPVAPLWIALVPALAAVTICALQLSTRAHWTGVDGYDDGVYVTSAIELVHGLVPYRDYTFVQPPGLTLVLAPIAALFRWFGLGSQDVLAAARVLTALVTGANCFLVAVLLRHRGRVAALVGGGVLCCFPAAFVADSSAYLEPYLDLFCLVAVVLLFRQGSLSTRSRPYLAGVAFALGADFKLWALLPAGLAFLWLWRTGVRRSLSLALGVLTGIVVVMGPFFVSSPRAYVHDVVSSQANRLSALGSDIGHRLALVTGYWPLHLGWPWLVVTVALLAALAVRVVQRTTELRHVSELAAFSAVLLVAVTVVLLVANPFYTHYSYFLAPWLSILAGLAIVRALPVAPASRVRRAVAVTVVAALALGTVTAVRSFQAFETTGQNEEQTAAARLLLQLHVHACVLSDEISFAVTANRLAKPSKQCPIVLDSYGVQLAEQAETAGDHEARQRQILAQSWKNWLEHARFVLLSSSFHHRLPWTVSLQRWFHQHFWEYGKDKIARLYKRRRSVYKGAT